MLAIEEATTAPYCCGGAAFFIDAASSRSLRAPPAFSSFSLADAEK